MSQSLTARELLRNRSIALIFGIEIATSIAQAGQLTALGWQAYARQHDPLVLGLIGLAEFVPAALLALPAGHAADRYDRRWVAGLGLLATTVVMAALAIDAASGDRAVWPLYVLALASGAAQAYVAPAFTPLLAASVPAASLARAVAMNTSTWQIGIIVGPALSGLLQRAGNPVPYILGVILALAATGLIALVPRELGRGHVSDDEQSLGAALDGIRLIFSSPPLLGAISLDLVAVLFGGVTALLPVFSRDILHVGALGNGLLRAAPGVGAVVIGLIMATRPPRRRIGRTLLVVVAVYGCFTVVFGLSRSFVLSLIAMAALAGADVVSVLMRGTLGPLLTPPALRGRVGAVERVFIGASNELGAFESGVLAALVGAVPAVVAGGAMSIAAAGLWAVLFPALRDIDRFEDIEAAEPP